MSGDNGSKSIRRAIKLIRVISDHQGKGVRLSNIARESGLHVATVRRILKALVDEGLVQYNKISKQYYLGLELFNLKFSGNQFEIIHRLRPVLESAAKQTGETVFLVIRSGNDSLCVDLVEGSAPIRIMPYSIGTRTPLGIGAGALSLIFKLPDSEIDQILSSNESRYAQYSAGGKNKIYQAILQSRERGYTISRNLFVDGVGGVGVPIYDQNGHVLAAISVASLVEKLNPNYCMVLANFVNKEINAIMGTSYNNEISTS
jgi:DNA-binding IclR family transcriptional regulator